MNRRSDVVSYMRNEPDFAGFVEDDMEFSDYLQRLSKSGTWGGYDCIVAFARLRGVTVFIHQVGIVMVVIHQVGIVMVVIHQVGIVMVVIHEVGIVMVVIHQVGIIMVVIH